MNKNKLIMMFLLLFVLISLAIAEAQSIFIKDSLYEGEKKIYTTENGIYVLELVIVSDAKKIAKFRLNDELSDSLKETESYVFGDGSEIVIKELLASETDMVEFYFYGSGKDVIPVILPKNPDPEDCNFNNICENETKTDFPNSLF